MKKNINTVKNENEMTEERKTIRERVKEILESINEKAKKEWAGDDSTLRYMKDYRFLQKDMSREVTTKEFEEWLEDTMKKYDCEKTYGKGELMKDLDFEYKSMKRRAEEKKEEGEKTLTNDTDKIEISSCANCYTPEDGIIHGTMTVADLKALDWKKDKNGIIAFDNGGKIILNFYRIKKNEPALSVWSKDQGGSTLCDVTLTDKQGRQHIMEVRAYLYERNCKKDQVNTQGDNWDWWGIKKFSQFVKEVTGYEL